MPATVRTCFAALLLLLASASLAQTPPPDGGPPYRVGGDVTRPQKTSGSAPAYTAEAREAKIMGVVILQTVIDEQGNVTEVEVLKGLPAGLEESAVKAVKSWKFAPATLHGKPVAVYYTLTVNFSIETDFIFGPLFSRFLAENSDFRDLVAAKRFGPALDLLDGRKADSDPEARLAKIYILSALRRIDEAWAEARVYEGADPFEAFNQIAFAALNAAAGSRDEKAVAGFLDLGLEASTEALAIRDDKQAMITRSQLLRRKAELVTDPQRAALLQEAGELEKRSGISR